MNTNTGAHSSPKPNSDDDDDDGDEDIVSRIGLTLKNGNGNLLKNLCLTE